MEAKHTAENWNFNQDGIFDEKGEQIASLLFNRYTYFKPRIENLSNAQRIVACVNAMKGVNNPAEFMEQVQQSFNANMDLKQQRNELLEALEKLYNSIDSCIDLTPELLNKCSSAIKKAKGE